MTTEHLNSSLDYPPYDVASMWAVSLGNGKYKIDNLPFYVRGVSS